MEKRNLARVAGVAAVAAALTLAGGASAQAQYTMKISTPTIHGSLEKWGELLQKGVASKTDKLKVQVYPASQLGAIPRTIEGAQLGTIEAVEVPPEFLSGVDPRFGIFSAPGVLTGMWQGYHALNDPAFRDEFWKVGLDKGIRIVGHDCDSPGDFATRNPIHKMSDFNGLKIRIFGSPAEREELRRVGATGVPMPLSEVLPAIQRHAIDGNKAGITVFVPFKYYNTIKNVFRGRESMICVIKFVSKTWYEGLPKDLQTMLWDEAQKANKDVMPWAVNVVNQRYKEWTQNGGTLTEFDAAEQKRFLQHIGDIGEQVFKGDPKALQLLDLLKKVAVKYKDTPSGT